ncbi:MAG: site-specific DNA-methyltransferase [Burkholderiales bacterium]
MRAALEQLKRQGAPYLNWAGKAERTSFAVDTVSLHVHERIDPASILAAVRKRMKDAKGKEQDRWKQPDLFAAPFENLPLRDAIDFYKHERGWANRLIAGDSLLVMNSLLQKEGMAGQVQMIYIDPPYGIKYGSNFQPFTNKRDVKDRRDEDLTQEPEMIKAFRDTWELGIHSYLTYLRDRLLLAKELLHESGSVFVQISDENIHLVRNLLDEVLGSSCYVCDILVKKKGSQKSTMIDPVNDYLLWYGRTPRQSGKLKFNPQFAATEMDADTLDEYRYVVDAESREQPVAAASSKDSEKFDYRLSPKRLAIDFPSARLFRANPLTSGGVRRNQSLPFQFRGQIFEPGAGNCWKATVQSDDGSTPGMTRLALANRLIAGRGQLRFRSYLDDFGFTAISNWWDGLGGASSPVYVVQTNEEIVKRCLLMTTDPGDLVLDPTCGSGTTAFVAEKWGRRWVTCDTSRVSVTLAKQRLMTASYDYYELKYPQEGLKAGFIYQTVSHVTLKSIANNPEIDDIYARMHPAVEEALKELNAVLSLTLGPSPGGRGKQPPSPSGRSAGDEGAVLREWEVPFDFPADWPNSARKPFEAFHTAAQAMQKQMDASIAAHADQETLYDKPAVSKDKLRITGPFTVEAVPFPSVLAMDEAQQPRDADATIARSGESLRQHSWRDELLKTGIRGKGGQMLKFAALETLPDTRYVHCTGSVADTGERVVVSFGPEHAALEQRQVEMAMREAGELFPRPKMIVFCAFTFDPEAAKDIDQTKGIVALKAQMNTDLLTEDLKKARASNQSFWLMGQPDVEPRKLKDGKYQIEVHGFDYFDTAKGELVSGGKGKIAVWLLDTDYDERSLFPRQVFFPMAGKNDGWFKLKKDIKAELNEDLLSRFHGTVSLPFEAGANRKVAVKIVDDRGIESLKVIPLD